MSKFMNSLTGIRGIAAIWVLLGHYSSYLFEQFGLRQDTLLQPFLVSAWAGVDLFFVLSGFIIAHTYVAGWTNSSKDIFSFWAKRVARLYPVYLVTTLLAAAFYGIAILINHSFDHQSASDLSPVTFVSNVLAIQQWFSISSLNGPAWSVSAEFFAYLVFPLLAFAILRRHSASLFGVVSVITIAGLFTLPSLESLNPKLWQVFFEFTLGACAYKMRLKLTRGFSKPLVTSARILAFTGALTTIYLSPTGAHNHGLVAIFCAVIIIVYSLPGEENSFLAGRVPVRLGYWSYSLYLTHRLIQNVTSGIGDIGTSNWVLDSIIFMALIGSAIALAGICYRFVEEPFRRRIAKTLLKKIG